MASAPKNYLKRAATTAGFPLIQCALCESEFDGAGHAARRLECGHVRFQALHLPA